VLSVFKLRSVRANLLAASAVSAVVIGSAAHAQDAPVVVQPTPAVATPTTGGTAPAATPAVAAPAAAGPTVAGGTDTPPADAIIVTGIRKSLQSATLAKRSSVAFGDSIFAEDIGKLPATNLAETLNRIPGVNINRDIDGQGIQVSIRGLGPSFTKVLLNGANIEVASDGGTLGGSTNREVDLDLFPSELFTRLDVLKTPVASTLEGGIAGTVNLRNARPFDRPGPHLTVIGQADGHDSSGAFGPRGAVIASDTWGNFGILAGFSGYSTPERIDGFETVGYTNANTGAFAFATTAPNNVPGLTPGQPVNLSQTSGLPLSTLNNALLPRLARDTTTIGTRSRLSGLVSLEWRPSDTLHFAIDTLYDVSKRDFLRYAMNWQVRNSGPGTGPTATGGMVPYNVTVAPNGVVTSGTFQNSSLFLENDVFNQTTKFLNVNPNMTWKPTDLLTVDAQVNYSHSTFFREQPQFDFQTTPQSGVSVTLQNNGGNQPQIIPNVNVNNPNLGWEWYRANVSAVRRVTTTKGAHVDTTYGEKTLNIKVGVAYDQASRDIEAFDNSVAYQNAVCGPTCAGTTGSVTNAQLPQFLMPSNINNFGHLSSSPFGYSKFIMDNLPALEKATNYLAFLNSAPQAFGAVTGGGVGNIDERTVGTYIEGNATTELFGRDLTFNAGVRYFHTDQMVSSPVQVSNGSVSILNSTSYDGFLPSFNVAYDATDHLKLRAAVSRTITRADAGLLLPGLTFSDPSAQVASAGNSHLKPYTSTNIDFGGEYYTGGIGYIGVDLFQKNINGYTLNITKNVPFSSLDVPFSSLTVTQQQALLNRAAITGIAMGDLPIQLTAPINDSKLLIRGAEMTFVQPLDFVVKGLGLRANATYLHQSSGSGIPAPGIAPWSYNLQGFYEAHRVSISLNYVWNGQSIAASAPQNGIIGAALVNAARGQLDLSTGYQLPYMNNAFRVTFDMLNITNAPIKTLFGFQNATYSVYYPGREFLMGIRASF